jgi:hypothetical protein
MTRTSLPRTCLDLALFMLLVLPGATMVWLGMTLSSERGRDIVTNSYFKTVQDMESRL